MPDDFLTQYIKAKKAKTPAAEEPDVSDLLERVRPAVFKQESGGNYQVRRNPRTKATGGFQVLPSNIGPWTEKYVGRRMTQDEFERDPNAQEQVFSGEFGRYLRKARAIAPDDDTAIRMAAAAWYGGEDDMKNYDANFGGAPGEPTFREYTSSVLGKSQKPTSFVEQYVKSQKVAPAAPPQPSQAVPMDDFATMFIRSKKGNSAPDSLPPGMTDQRPHARDLLPPYNPTGARVPQQPIIPPKPEVSIVGDKLGIVEPPVPAPPIETLGGTIPATGDPYAAGEGYETGKQYQDQLEKRGRELGYNIETAPQATDYQQFLTDTGLPDTPESQKEFDIVQQTLAKPIPQEPSVPQTGQAARQRHGVKPTQPSVSQPRQAGRSNEDLNTVAGEYTPAANESAEQATIKAVEQIGRQYGITPQQVREWVAARNRDGIGITDPNFKPGVAIQVPFSVIAEIKGEDATKYDIRSEQAQARTSPDVGIDLDASPDEAYKRLGYRRTKDDAEWLNSNAGDALVAVNPLFAVLDKEQRDNIGASVAGGFLGSGARAWRTLAGIARPINTDVYEYMQSIAEPGEALEAKTGNGGFVSTLAKVAGGAPGDLSRLYLLTRIPGAKLGPFTSSVIGFAADSGLMSAGRGEELPEVAKQTGKGAALGALFGSAPTIGRLFGEPAAVTAVGAGSAAIEKLAGSSDEQALQTGIINGLFHFGGVLGRAKLADKVVRARNSAGKEIKAGVTPEGEIKLLRGADNVKPDIEMYFNEKTGVYEAKGDATPTRAKEEPYSVGNRGRRLETSQEPRQLEEYNPQRIETPDPQAIQKVSVDTRARKIVDSLRGKDFQTIEAVAKEAKVNKVLAEDAVMELYGAGMVELLPGNRVRLIKEANTGADLFERAKTYGQTPEVPAQPSPMAKKPLVPTQQPPGTVPAQATGKTVSDIRELETSAVQTTETVAPDIQRETAQRYKPLPEQKPQVPPVEKPKAKVITAERPDTAKLLQVFTERGTKASIEPKVIDAKDILTSLDEGYPQEFQPRDRSRVASRAQISEIANKLNPEFLGDSPKASDGRPLVVPVEMPDSSTKYAVISGNGRTAAIREAYNAGSEPSQRYSEFARTKASGETADVQQPIYVGVLDAKEIDDIPEFAREANESSVAAMSATEQAKADAERLTPEIMAQFVPADDGSIHSAANRDFTRAFLDAVGTNEQARLVMPDGSLNQDGVNRVRNAIFAKAFGETEKGTAAIQRMAESTNDSVKNVTTAMLGVSGPLASYKEAAKSGTRHNDYEISNDIAAAVAEYAKLKSPDSAFKDLDEYISQGNLFGAETTPFQTRLMQVFDANKRSPKAVRTIFNEFLRAADAAGDPNQANLFGTDQKISVESLFESAIKAYERTASRQVSTEPAGLFEDQGLRRQGQPETRQAGHNVPAEVEGRAEERPELETVAQKARTQVPEPAPASDIPANQPEGKPLPLMMRSVVRRANASPEVIADFYDLDVNEVKKLRAITEANVGRFGQTSHYIRKALSPDDAGSLINKLAKQVVPQARIHVNNPLFDRQSSINVILDTLASDAGKLRSSEMDASDWKKLFRTRPLPDEFRQIVSEAINHQADWFRRRQQFKDDPGVAQVMQKVAEIGDLPGGLEQLVNVEWGNQQKSTLPATLKKQVILLGKKYGLSVAKTQETFLEAVRRTASEELGRRNRESDRPEAQEEETEQPSLGDFRFMVAWHGSPHTFDKFDISKIGTGEGAQAYGHGLYFTDKEAVADFYREKLSKKGNYSSLTAYADDIRVGNKTGKDYQISFDRPLVDAATAKDKSKVLELAKAEVGRWQDLVDSPGYPHSDYAKEMAAKYRAFVDDVEQNGVSHGQNSGAKYKVELKPAEDEYLLWDKPLSEQSEKVKKALVNDSSYRALANRHSLDASDLYRHIAEKQALENGDEGRDEPAASEYLKSLGIRGIKYLDGSSRGKGEGSYNYVLFDDADVEITDIMTNRPVVNDKRGATQLAREIGRLAENPKATPEKLAIIARAKIDADAVLTVNPAGAVIINKAISDLARQDAPNATGIYANQRIAAPLVEHLLRRAKGSPEYRRFAQTVASAFQKTGEHRDLTIVVKTEGSTEASKFTRQEELTHRANARTGARGLFVDIAETPSIKKAVENISTRGYSGIPLIEQVDEVIAKSHRDDAASELGLSDAEVADNLIAFWNAAAVADVDVSGYLDISESSRSFYESKRGQRNVEDEPDRTGVRSAGDRDNQTLRREGSEGRPRPRPFAENDEIARLHDQELLGAGRGQTESLISPKERAWIERQSKGNTALAKAASNEILYARADEGPRRAAAAILDIVSAPKSLKSSVDLSAAGRQGFITGVAHPVLAARAFKKQLAAFMPFSGAAARERFVRDLNLHPNIEAAEAAGLFLASLADENSLTEREEAFMSRLFGENRFFKNNKFEAARKLATAGVRISERAYLTYLDALRIEVFSKLAREMQAYNIRKGRPNTAEQFEGIANFINYATGRGSLGPATALAPYLNAGFFSARYWASRLQVMNPVFYATLPKGARSIVFKDLAKFIGAVGLTMFLLKMAGFEIEMDDPDDPNTLKIGFGSYKYDISAGLITHMRYIARMLMSLQADPKDTRKPTAKMVHLTERYIRSKLGPVPAAVWNTAEGETYIKEPTSAKEEASNLVLPFSVTNFTEAVKADGTPGLALMAPEFFGIGVSRFKTVEELQKKITEEQSKLVESSTTEEKREVARRIKLWKSQIRRAQKNQIAAN